jgi:hypothetical protein
LIPGTYSIVKTCREQRKEKQDFPFVVVCEAVMEIGSFSVAKT